MHLLTDTGPYQPKIPRMQPSSRFDNTIQHVTFYIHHQNHQQLNDELVVAAAKLAITGL